MEPAVLYVDDEKANLSLFSRWFDDEFTVHCVDSGPRALELLERGNIGVLVTDQRMQPMTGIELAARACQHWPDVSRMLLTAYSDRDLLFAAINEGHIHDYVLKPWQGEELHLRLEQALEAHRKRVSLRRAGAERDRLRAEVEERAGYTELVGMDAGLSELAAMLEKVAITDSTVLVRGESGTGKELVARAIHRRSKRQSRPFVRTNCAALAEGLLESELFGHEAGAFTGASKRRIGRFEEADGGTLFLDEIGDISQSLQVRLLRVLQERELERVGGNETVSVDIRVIAATHRDLEAMVGAGDFRQDLYHRLNVVPLVIPPLRERPQDIAALAEHFVAEFADEMGKQLSLGDEAHRLLRSYDWPGNVRELRNVIERAAVLADPQCTLDEAELIFDFTGAQPATERPVETDNKDSVFDEIAEAEANEIREALRQARGSKAGAARLLGIPRTTLNDRIRRLGIT